MKLLLMAMMAFALNCISPVYAADKPPLLLAGHYHSGIDIRHYYVSEKLDGVRAYWDGQQLWSRQGNRFHAPDWFLEKLPPQRLDGELWIGRGQFEKTVSVVRKHQPIDEEWQQVRYYIFDLPGSSLPFSQRLQQVYKLAYKNHPFLKPVKQWQVETHEELKQQLDAVVAEKGEGLMLHHKASLYRSGRSEMLLKVKAIYDAEATVLAHLPGQGKYAGMMGSLLVATEQGLQFKIGTGFSDAQREAPPEIGATITYSYRGFTRNGIPRHASFIRVRHDNNL